MNDEHSTAQPSSNIQGGVREPSLAALRDPGCWPIAKVQWQPAYRVVPTRLPAITLFDRVASASDFDTLYALEAITNDRLRTEVGEIDLVPPEERRFGPGYGPIMAALTHLNPAGSRFSPGTFGVFYCARDARTAIAETRYHTALFLSATHEPPMRQPMRLYTVIAQGNVLDLRDQRDTLAPTILHPHDYTFGQALGTAARHAGHAGIAYPSVRDPHGECLAAFRTTLLRQCHHAAYLEYNWNGSRIDVVFELTQVG
ncbi:RES domain-containing protein [Mycetohabitans endofungorum]|uniref:RES domain-containing protein n=1 Tax=Mycetohabitans endofungorum TaxID=417203 RepID=A0A2P5K7S6_9BURK|nr:RES domain-containing protein [Mycetohabitans endofungorum]